MSIRFLAVGMAGSWVRGLTAGILLALAAGPAGASVITASPVNFSASEQSLFSGTVATFTDDNPAATPADFVAVIDWGDGSSSIGTITENAGTFSVSGQHTYDDEGTFSATVTITEQEPGDGFASVTDTATIAEADVLSGTPRTFAASSGVSFTTTVADFSDTLTSAVASDFMATIDWGDATTSAGTVSGGSGSFQVSGTHTYASPGTYSVTVTLSDDPPGTATATVTSTAQVTTGLSVIASSFSTPEGTPFNGTVATFSDSDTSKTAADFTVVVNWGDGTTSPGTVTGSSGSFTVTGPHTYADEGNFTFTVTVTEIGPGGATASDSATATVTEADQLAGSPVIFTPLAGSPFSGVVATFTDANTAGSASDFTATIDWGDGTTTAGVVSGGNGTFTVSGTHTYASAGSYPVIVTLTDDPPGTATAMVTSTANVEAPVIAVPTLDVWGLLALGAILAGAAMYRMRGRRGTIGG
jgi:PKD repeat protein